MNPETCPFCGGPVITRGFRHHNQRVGCRRCGRIICDGRRTPRPPEALTARAQMWGSTVGIPAAEAFVCVRRLVGPGVMV